MPGAATSKAEVSNVSPHGFWVLLDDRELFLPFEEFPWFRRAPIEAILRLERPHSGAPVLARARHRPFRRFDRTSAALSAEIEALTQYSCDAAQRRVGGPSRTSRSARRDLGAGSGRPSSRPPTRARDLTPAGPAWLSLADTATALEVGDDVSRTCGSR